MTTARKPRYGHCYRCIYTWRMRKRSAPMCPRCRSRLWRVPKIRPVVLGSGLGIEDVLLPRREEILRLTAKFGDRNVRVFGSVRRRQADERSDVDLLLTWRKGTSLLDVAGVSVAVSRVLGRDVDAVEEPLLHFGPCGRKYLAGAVAL